MSVFGVAVQARAAWNSAIGFTDVVHRDGQQHRPDDHRLMSNKTVKPVKVICR
jgi:hypothetical protein